MAEEDVKLTEEDETAKVDDVNEDEAADEVAPLPPTKFRKAWGGVKKFSQDSGTLGRMQKKQMG